MQTINLKCKLFRTPASPSNCTKLSQTEIINFNLQSINNLIFIKNQDQEWHIFLVMTNN